MTSNQDLPTTESKKPDLGSEIVRFTRHIDAIGEVLSGTVHAVQHVTKVAHKKLVELEEAQCTITQSDDKRIIEVPTLVFREWKRHSRRFHHLSLARKLLTRSLLVSLVSQYDAYLGRILRAIFLHKPEILNGSERKISFETLNQFDSIEAAREYILEKEVESILRTSHSEQFNYMEKSFGLPLQKGLQCWPLFIEVTERRNLFAHTDGIISSQYMTVCRKHQCKLEESIKEGTLLDVPQTYFYQAHQCIYEIGVKLGQVLWRKLFPEEHNRANASFNQITYDLIDAGKYDIAIQLLDFACEEFKRSSGENYQLMCVVNRAQAYKWKGEEERCKKIMRAVDWTTKGEQFRLADAVLAGDWARSVKVMKRIGRDGPVEQANYHDWPRTYANPY